VIEGIVRQSLYVDHLDATLTSLQAASPNDSAKCVVPPGESEAPYLVEIRALVPAA
jgi:hypothetical protein